MIPRFRPSRASRFFVLAALWLGGCFSNDPDQTGLDYLAETGVRLTTPLRHYTFRDFPVDSVFSTELPLNHFGETRLLVGRDGPFRAAARMGFQITAQAQRDSIARGLRLRLAAEPRSSIGASFLKASTAGRDSITLLVESFAWSDTAGKFNDSLQVFHRRILTSLAPFSTLEARYRVRDTARIALAAAFADSNPDTLQVLALKNLQSRLRTDSLRSWQVFLEISPVDRPGTSPDSGLFRFLGNPGLLMGGAARNTASTAEFLSTYASGGLAAVNYQVTHSGSGKNTLLYGVSRGLNFRLSRDSLLDSVRARMGAEFPAAPAGKYDTRFHVPYAEIHFPLADSMSRVDGPFALDMQLTSEVDSVPTWMDTGLAQVALNGSLKLYAMPSGDSLVFQYQRHPLDTASRRLIAYWARSATVQDTFLLSPDGGRREITLRRYAGWQRAATLGVYPEAARAWVEVYFNVGAGAEPNGFLDSATGAALTSYQDLAARYWRPGAANLEVRATRGMGALLNRASGVQPEFFLKPSDRFAFDTAKTADSLSYRLIPFPVLGEIGFPRQNGKLRVTVDVYLYPLRSKP